MIIFSETSFQTKRRKKKMPKKSNKIRSVAEQGSSDEDHTSLSDLKKFMEKNFKDLKSTIQEVNGRVKNLEDGMERLSIATKRNMIETKAHSTGPRRLKLVFRNKISLPVGSGEEIKGVGGKDIEIALVDEVTENVIDFGQEASAHVGIFALDGKRDTWIIGKYKKKSVSNNEEERSVLAGQVEVKLNKGIGSLANLKFRNSAYYNSGVFKLGAKVMDSFDGTLIKEAMTESFAVKDYRKKYKQKKYPPSLSDEIWRLKNIEKDGCIHERVKENVKTVGDFLIQHLKDPAELKSLFQLPEQRWKATVNHAQTCTINQRVCCSINSQEKKGVVFNVVGKTLGLIKDWNYVQHDILSEEDKVEATKLLASAIKEVVKDFDNEESLLQYLSCQSTAAPTNSPRPENTVSHQVETSDIGESDQSNIDASSQDAWTSKYPNTGIVSQEVEATDLDRVELQDVFPSDHRACTGPEASLHGPIHVDQANVDDMNLIASSQELLESKNPSGGSASPEAEGFIHDGLGFQGPIRNTKLEDPVYSPYIDQAKNFDASLEDAYPSLSPLWRESIYQYNMPSSSSLIDDYSYGCTQSLAGQSYSSSNLWSEGGFNDCQTQAANRSWKRLKKKRRIS